MLANKRVVVVAYLMCFGFWILLSQAHHHDRLYRYESALHFRLRFAYTRTDCGLYVCDGVLAKVSAAEMVAIRVSMGVDGWGVEISEAWDH